MIAISDHFTILNALNFTNRCYFFSFIKRRDMNFLLKLFVLGVSAQLGLTFVSFVPETDVWFLLRTRDRAIGGEEIFTYGGKDKLEGSTFNPSKLTVFQIHGFMEDRTVKQHTQLSM
jgi:hypothetical protein